MGIKFTVDAVKKISIFFGKEVVKQSVIEFVKNLSDYYIGIPAHFLRGCPVAQEKTEKQRKPPT